MKKLIRKIKSYLKVRSHYSKTVNELSRLNNRDLADLGISRSDIERIAWRSAMRLSH